MGGNSATKGSSNTTNQIPPELSGLTSQTANKIGETQNKQGFDVSEYGKPHVQNVPGLAGGQQEAINQAYGIGRPSTGTTNAYSSLMAAPQWASQSGQATGGTLANDPSIAAAYNTYKMNVEPDLQSQYGMMGLGKSTLLGDSLARGAASQMQPAIEGALGREQSANENRIGRETSTALGAASQYAGLGQQDLNQRLASLNALMQTGGLERSIGSEQSAAEQSDYLRQQSLAEQNLYGVLGQLPSSLGSQVTSKTSGSGK